MRCPASLRLSIASSRTVSSSAMSEVYEQVTSDHSIVSPSRASRVREEREAGWLMCRFLGVVLLRDQKLLLFYIKRVWTDNHNLVQRK